MAILEKPLTMNHIKPGNWVSIIKDGQNLRRRDEGSVFTIERGLPEPLYGVYCHAKDIWEYLEENQLEFHSLF